MGNEVVVVLNSFPMVSSIHILFFFNALNFVIFEPFERIYNSLVNLDLLLETNFDEGFKLMSFAPNFFRKFSTSLCPWKKLFSKILESHLSFIDYTKSTNPLG